MKDRTVLITGCSSGFGRALVPVLLGRHWTVIASLRNAEARTGLFSQELKIHPHSLHVISLDVTNEQEREKAFEFARDRFHRLDVLINNAGHGLFGALEDVSETQLRQQMEANFFGTAFMTRTFLPLLRQARGKILNISSVMGSFGMPLSSGYCSSKFALEGLSECLYYELKPFGVQVCLVEPGRHRTDFSRNMVWGEKSQDSRSLYTRLTEAFDRRRERLGKRVVPQENVVRVIVKLCETPRVPLRVPVGKDALLAQLIQTLLPQRLRTALLWGYYEWTLRKNLQKS